MKYHANNMREAVEFVAKHAVNIAPYWYPTLINKLMLDGIVMTSKLREGQDLHILIQDDGTDIVSSFDGIDIVSLGTHCEVKAVIKISCTKYDGVVSEYDCLRVS